MCKKKKKIMPYHKIARAQIFNKYNEIKKYLRNSEINKIALAVQRNSVWRRYATFCIYSDATQINSPPRA